VIGSAYHRRVELRQLRYFVAVAEELHFRRAAERLHIAQASVSQQVRTLEDELGVQLLRRDRRTVALTPAGEALLTDARDLLAREHHAADRARAIGAGELGRLRLSLTRSLTGGLAGEIVAAYRKQHPGVVVELGVGNTSLHAEKLREGSLDVAFVRPPLLDPDLEELALAREPLVCVLPSEHPLARRRRIRREDIREEPLVWWPRDHGPGAWVEMLSGIYGPDAWPAVSRTEPEEERLVAAVAEGAGVSFIMLERSRFLRMPGAVYRRFAAPEPTAGVALAWRRGTALPALDRLREVAARVAGEAQ
jgi:DNA-binding transcriptional LysR family regulator